MYSNFQGKNLLKTFFPHNYHVTVGEQECEDIFVTMDEIRCKPPKTQPKDPHEDKPRVRVNILCYFMLLFVLIVTS